MVKYAGRVSDCCESVKKKKNSFLNYKINNESYICAYINFNSISDGGADVLLECIPQSKQQNLINIFPSNIINGIQGR